MERAENRTAKTKAARELREDDLARIAEMLNNGVSQRKIAEAMGVSQAFISRYKNPGTDKLTVQDLKIFCLSALYPHRLFPRRKGTLPKETIVFS